MPTIRIHTESTGDVRVQIIDKNPKTAQLILNALPFESKVKKWGDELYFEIPVRMEIEEGEREVDVGDVGYWPEGGCMCIFFGKTPISTSKKPVAYSDVNVFAKIIGDSTVFKKVKNGEIIRVSLELS